MPNCADNYENQIDNGKNVNSVKCKFCHSKILSANAGEFINIEVIQLFIIKLFSKIIINIYTPLMAYI